MAYSGVGFDLEECSGVFGGYIADPKKRSFIYCPAQQEFCRLRNPDRAVAVSHTQGPIFGDGDIVIGDGAIHNSAGFPSSYHSNKVQKLFKQSKFEVTDYDVYDVIF